MIGRLSGALLARHPPQVLLEVQGVGYEIELPLSAFPELPPPGNALILHIHLVIREDAHLLFGFPTIQQRDLFRQLLKITGVGPRLALALLSSLSLNELGQAIAQGNVARLTKVPGVGKKTAERLLLELREKLPLLLPPDPGASTPALSTNTRDLEQALQSLGYNEREISWALEAVPPESTLEEGIRQALKRLVRRE